MALCYLVGPINDCNDDEAMTWREKVKAKLGEENCLDPMRRDFRGKEDESVGEIVHGDLDDLRACDYVIANCWQPSWGTAMEIAFASNQPVIGGYKPVIAVVPEGVKISPWLRYHTKVIVRTLDEAIAWAKSYIEIRSW